MTIIFDTTNDFHVLPATIHSHYPDVQPENGVAGIPVAIDIVITIAPLEIDFKLLRSLYSLGFTEDLRYSI